MDALPDLSDVWRDPEEKERERTHTSIYFSFDFFSSFRREQTRDEISGVFDP